MKKRILSLALLCAMLLTIVLSCVSCGEESKIDKALRKSRELDFLDADLLLELDVEVNDREKTGKLDGNNKPEYTESWDSRDYQMAFKILEATLESGEVLARETSNWYGDKEYSGGTYFDKDYAYLPNGTKQLISEYKKYNTYYADLVRALLGDLPSAIFVEDEDGNKMVKVEDISGITFISESFEMKDDEQLKAFEKITSPLLELIKSRVVEYMVCPACRDGKNSCAACGDKVEDCTECAAMRDKCATCQITDVEYYGKGKMERKLENGYATESLLEFKVEMSVGEDEIYIEGKLKTVINNPGKEVGIKFPYEYTKYPLVAISKRPTIMELIK